MNWILVLPYVLLVMLATGLFLLSSSYFAQKDYRGLGLTAPTTTWGIVLIALSITSAMVIYMEAEILSEVGYMFLAGGILFGLVWLRKTGDFADRHVDTLKARRYWFVTSVTLLFIGVILLGSAWFKEAKPSYSLNSEASVVYYSGLNFQTLTPPQCLPGMSYEACEDYKRQIFSRGVLVLALELLGLIVCFGVWVRYRTGDAVIVDPNG